MRKTVVIQIGNTDDKLTQKEWSEFMTSLRIEVEQWGFQTHFFGHSEPSAQWQNCCVVFEVDSTWVRASRGWASIDEYVERKIMPSLANMAAWFKQDSIAIQVGETIFVEASK